MAGPSACLAAGDAAGSGSSFGSSSLSAGQRTERQERPSRPVASTEALAPVSRALSSLPNPQEQTDRRVQDQRHRGDKPRRVAAFGNIDARADNDPNPAPQSQNPGERLPVALCVHGQTIVLTSSRSLRAQGQGAVSVETTGVGADPRGTQRPNPETHPAGLRAAARVVKAKMSGYGVKRTSDRSWTCPTLHLADSIHVLAPPRLDGIMG